MESTTILLLLLLYMHDLSRVTDQFPIAKHDFVFKDNKNNFVIIMDKQNFE